MSFISISIDICGSTEAKAKLREHSECIGTEAPELYDLFQKQVLRVEETFWTILRSSKLDIERLFLIKSIGDEVWYAYDLKELESYDSKAAVARMIEALVGLQTKHFDLVAGPPEDPFNWENVDPDTLLRIDMPLKITIDLVTDALEVGTVREKYLAPHVASLLSPLGKFPKPVQAGDDGYINLCNRLGIANKLKTDEKVISSIRSDYIGWEVDRFFRLTKAAIKGTVLIGPKILSDFDTHDLIVRTDSERGALPKSSSTHRHSSGLTGFCPTSRLLWTFYNKIFHIIRNLKSEIRNRMTCRRRTSSAWNNLGMLPSESQSKAGWSISNIMIRVCCGPKSFTSLGGNYMLATRYLPAEEQKGVGAGCNIGIVYSKYQQNVEFNSPLQRNAANKANSADAKSRAAD